jgi:hypothetical protein
MKNSNSVRRSSYSVGKSRKIKNKKEREIECIKKYCHWNEFGHRLCHPQHLCPAGLLSLVYAIVEDIAAARSFV